MPEKGYQIRNQRRLGKPRRVGRWLFAARFSKDLLGEEVEAEKDEESENEGRGKAPIGFHSIDDGSAVHD